MKDNYFVVFNIHLWRRTLIAFMKKFLFTLVALMMAGSLCAEEYLYLDDFTAAPGTTVSVPLKAHFDYYVSAYQIDLVLPEGMTLVNAYAGEDMSIPYVNEYGQEDVYDSPLHMHLGNQRFIAANTEGGYWLVDGQWALYGAVKWDPGEYDEMFWIVLQVAADFSGGDITVMTEPACGFDNRGPICQYGSIYYKVASVGIGGTTPDPGPGEDPVEATFSFTMPNITVKNINTIAIPVSMRNTGDVTAFQTDIYLPAGFSVAMNEDDDFVIEPAGRMADHMLMSNTIPSGAVRVLCYSPTLQNIEGEMGELFYIGVNIPEGAEGDYEVVLKNTRVTTTGDREVTLADATCELTIVPFIAGDANGNGEITVTDVVSTAMFILNYDTASFDLHAADMNGDGDITVTDVVIIARMVQNGGHYAPMHAPALGDIHDIMSGSQVDIEAGETRTVSIMLDNEVDYTAFEFMMRLPEGLTATNFRMTDRAGNHDVDATDLGRGKMRVLGYSAALESFNGNSGALLTFDVTATGNVNGSIDVSGIEMVTPMGQTVKLGKFSMNVNGTTSVKNVTAATRIYSDGRNVIVESPADVTVIVSDVMGRAQSVNAKAGRTVIPVNNAGIYVVKAGDQTAKMNLR